MKLIFKSNIEPIQYSKPILVIDQKIFNNNILFWQLFQNQSSGEYAHGFLQILPNFHHSSLKDIQEYLANLFLNHDLDFSSIDFTKPYFNILKIIPTQNLEYLFCAEAILFEILYTHFKNALPLIINNEIKVNALASFENLPESTLVSCLKIKIQPKFSKQYFQNLNKLLSNSKDLIIRFDGNRQFSNLELDHFLEMLSTEIGNDNLRRIEYIEEALTSPDEYFEIFNKYKIPQALDESVLSFESLKHQESVSTFVLKPSVLSISKCFSLIKKNNHKLNFVISSTYEPAQTLLAHLYLTQLTSKTFHGLGTLEFLPKNYTNIPSPFFLFSNFQT